jgi:very-short-patch-repair endonuclease
MTKKTSNYNKKHKPLARALRKHGTPGEAILWSQVLRAKSFYGLQFNRQYPVDKYIADFICRKLKLIIELDGSSHDEKEERDRIRDERLAELGYKVLRIRESDVMEDLNDVVKIIEDHLPQELLNRER